jgi:pimeloyl-ACP methyl ester carboxylesterase
MLHYNLTGAGETIVFLHGALVSMRMWDDQVAYFKDRYRVLTADLPEHGGSKGIILPAYDVESIGSAVMELLDALHIDRFHLCGHSLGGMAAQEIVLHCPERVQCLILAETSYGTSSTLPEKLAAGLTKPLLYLLPKKQFIDLSKNTYGKLHEHVKYYIENEMSVYSMKQYRRIMAAAFRYESRKKLADIKNKALILMAENNRQTHKQGREMHRLIEDSKLVVIPKSHHLLNMDNPLAFNREIERFISDNRCASPV